MLSSKTLHIIGTIEVLREGQADIRHALATLFQPDLHQLHGRVYDAQELASKINTEYRIGVTKDVLEDFIPIFIERGWLSKIDAGTSQAYIVDCPPDAAIAGDRQEFSKQVEDLGEEFAEFVKELSPLTTINQTPQDLVDSLVDWLMKLDLLNGDAVRSASTVEKVGTTLTYHFDSGEEMPLSDSQFLCARFCERLFKDKSKHITFLSELAGVGLITEVVRDFHKPSSDVKKTDLIVYLDAPIALDFLGLSGPSEQSNIKNILERIVAIGGALRVHRLSVEEMQSNLSAMLARPAHLRTGQTAEAMRRREVIEAYVRQVAAKPETSLEAAGISILDQSLDLFPNEHKYFTKDTIDEMYSQVNWVKEDSPRYHDAAITALIMRKRAGRRTADIFDTKHVVITRNARFAALSKRISKEKSYLNDSQLGPVIHQRQFATAIWLRSGSGVSDIDIPR